MKNYHPHPILYYISYIFQIMLGPWYNPQYCVAQWIISKPKYRSE